MSLQHLRSSTANKRPVPGNMSDGQIAINTNTGSPGLFFKDSNNTLVKVGPVHVGTTAPNASPASGGTAGNSVGEQWLDTTGGTYVFKVWDGSAWRSESGTFVDVNGDVMTGALGIIAGSAGAPGLYISGDANTGVFSPSADALALSTGGSERLRITSAGLVGVGTSVPLTPLAVSGGITGGNTAVTNAEIAFPSAQANAYLRLLGNYQVGAGRGGTIQLGGKSFSDSGTISSFLISAESLDNATSALTFSTQTAFNNSIVERLRVTSDGYVRLTSSSPGIQFNGDTALANTLDDYEEGTFTPSIVGTSTAGTATYGANGQQGRYTKIGNRVFFDLYLAWSAHTGTGDLQINGLPFTVQNTTNLNRTFSAIFSNVALTAGSIGAAFSSPNTTTIALRQLPTGGGSVATVPMDTSAQISISGSFDV